MIAALLLAAGRIDRLAAPLWAKLVCPAALIVGTTLGGWRIIRKRELLTALRAAFVTPLGPEDVSALSRGIDPPAQPRAGAHDESEAMACPPDARIADMASLLAGALRHVDTAVASLGSGADVAITLERRLEHVCYAGMAELLEIEDRHERIARRELYRSSSRLGETVVDVAERVVYAVMKES